MAAKVSEERLRELNAAKQALVEATATVAAAARQQKLYAAEFQALMLRTAIEAGAGPQESMKDDGTWAEVVQPPQAAGLLGR